MAEKTSPSGSMKGWQFKKWLAGNKESAKLLISATTGLITAGLSGLSTWWAVGLGTVVGAGSKLVLDSIDFWVSDVSLE